MKRLIIMVLLLLLPLVRASVDIGVKTAYTSPYPVEPGKNFLLGVEITNKGDEEAKNVLIEIAPNSPFSVIDKQTESITSLSGGGLRVVEYKLFVDSSAVSSTYQLPIKIKYSGSEDITRNVFVRVQGKPNIAYIDVPNFSISPGETKTMRVDISNLGSGVAKRVIATITPLNENIKVVFSGGNYFVGDIQPNEKKSAYFQLYIDTEANYGVYDANIKIVYEDESGNLQTKNFSLGIFVTGKPEIKIIKIDVDESKGELKVDIVNDGNVEARGIKGELLIGGGVVDVDYISKINAQKSSTLKFKLPSGKEADLRITYSGSNNEKYSFIEKISWQVEKRTNWLALLFGLAIAYFVLKNYAGKIFTKLKKHK
ncbi:MAG: hypothetical protein N3E38_03120 [Candidatus Aenigmarchaeota archaeon]|nr:hypothetical protein [Candidatus Aenigmarchaeota archaeon]MCX8179692.1 hypothetical protein [Candidatus Aenigmarchaeota archaeon]